jgi:hypothetical protein
MSDGVDILGLRGASLERLLDVMGAQDLAGQSWPALAVLAEMAVDEAVRLVRQGTRMEILEAGDALAGHLRIEGKFLPTAPGARDTLKGLLPVLTAAASPSSLGGEGMVLRSWDGKAMRALTIIAASPAGSLTGAVLCGRLGMAALPFGQMISDLEEASLLERIKSSPGDRSGPLLTSKGRECLERPSDDSYGRVHGL